MIPDPDEVIGMFLALAFIQRFYAAKQQIQKSVLIWQQVDQPKSGEIMKTLPLTLQRLTAITQITAKPAHHLFASLSLGVITLFCTATVDAATPAVAAAGQYTVALKSDGTVWAWGSYSTTPHSAVPVQVSGLTGVIDVAAGRQHTVALKSDGTVWTWGINGDGQLGNNSTTHSAVPVQVLGLTGVVDVAAGYSHTVVLKSDGTVWAWGSNARGELGNNSTTNSAVPVQASALPGVVSVAAGIYYTTALKSDGTVWSWGYNIVGQLGNSSTADSLVPVQAMGLTGVTGVSAGAGFHTLALKSDGTVWTWGSNSYGQLCRNANPSIPAQASGITGVNSVSAGQLATVALKSDGTVWACGYNAYGGLGNNSTINSAVPVQVSGLTGVVGAATGILHMVALKSDGTVWAWGNNAYGGLGNNSTVGSLVPVQVVGPNGQGFLNLGQTTVTSSTPLPVAAIPVPLSPPASPPGAPAINIPTSQSALCEKRVVSFPDASDAGDLYLCSDTFDMDKPTVVISHGWNSSNAFGNYTIATPGWMKAMAEKIGNRANVLLWNWQKRAETLLLTEFQAGCLTGILNSNSVAGCGVPYVYVPSAGQNLASAIDGLLCTVEGAAYPACLQSLTAPLYQQKIHFIGHSLGTGVITWAAGELKRYKANVDQLSFLDSAYLTVPPGEPNTWPDLRSRGVFVDNYRSLVGTVPFSQPWAYSKNFVDTNIFLPNVHVGGVSYGCGGLTDGLATEPHGYSHLWLTSSWDNFQCPGLLRDIDRPSVEQEYGTAWSVARNGIQLRQVGAPYYSSVSPDHKWNLNTFDNFVTANGFATIVGANALLELSGFTPVAKIAAQTVTELINNVGQAGQTGANLVSGAITKAVGQFGASAIQFSIQKDVQTVKATVNLVGDVGQMAAGGVTYALTETKRLSTQATTALVNEAVAAQTAIKVKALNTFDTASEIAGVAVDKAGHATWQFFGDLTGGALDLSLNSDATIHLNQFIPADATSMRFNFDFLVADQGTLLEAFIDGVPVFIAHSSNHVGKGNHLSEWINAAPFAGKTVNIEFRLSNPVEGNRGTVRLDDLFFARITPVDAPYAVAVAPGIARLGSKIQLDGTRSTDLGGTLPTLSYKWVQVSGPITSLQSELSPSATFTPTTSGQYQFALSVSDGVGDTDPATLTVSVLSLGDIDGDGDVDSNDLAKITSALNQPASGPNDLRDLDGDKKITALDSRKLVTLCTRPRCATQ